MKDAVLFNKLKSRTTISQDGCWLWNGYKHAGGYGAVKVGTEVLATHRAMWLAVHGTLPRGARGPYVCHHCDVRLCINPQHLWLGSAKANSVDRDQKGRNGFSSLTHCKRGHEFTPENTYQNRNGRGCRACEKILRAKYRERKRQVPGYKTRAPVITEDQRSRVLALRAQGKPYKAISLEVGVTVAMAFRAAKNAGV